ncbi:hypothetical protein BKA67DRAFT_670730 [Truncatella angustata]|uniref:Uncharacterized protein n=1 Tax=Truncatella angustata TaxID=152316 RepID=A0A9P8UAS7_9PEZI|nr:uncharacterized protein BKA67DRAFT_670730 [Truncatella angustata]KAH6645152.1 hypothetical protein BKA67DRAFT_670730 [Truncatella angustata]
MSADTSDSFCTIEPNPDVTGTGIRVSIYALCLAAGILKTVIQHVTSAENYAEFCQALNSALQLQGLALLCTAIVQTFQAQLTLFHALCVLHLLSLLGFGLVAQRKYHDGGGFNRWLVLAFLRVIIAGAFVALTAYIWVTAPTFGAQPECNADTVYVVFGVSIPATSPIFRYVILGLMASMAVGWVLSMVFTVFFASCCCDGGARGTAKRMRHANPDVAVLKNVWARVRITDQRHRGSIVSGQVIQMLVHTGINIYMIVTLEQIVERNHLSEDEAKWTFGQVLALFVLLGVVVEVVNILLPKLDQVDSESENGDVELVNRVEGVRQPRLLGV